MCMCGCVLQVVVQRPLYFIISTSCVFVVDHSTAHTKPCILSHLNSRLTLRFFSWLVGPMEVVEVEIADSDPDKDLTVKQLSGVQIHRCRYLAESNCTAMCVNLCKSPCQTFFTEELGMPLYMEPNFEDQSCLMIFGQNPPPLDQDPAAQQSCLSGCVTAVSGSRCHKLEE